MAEAEQDPEDEEELSQWMPICDDCDNPVEHYCTTCGDKLCTGCKDHHLSRRKNRDHQIVPYSAGMRATQKRTCPKHPGERYQLYCKPCKIPVCTPCIAQSHSDHVFISLPEALSFARENAISNLEVLTKKMRPRLKDECDMLKTSEDEALQSISTVEQEIENSGKELHAMVDLLIKENKKQLTKTMEESTLSVLRKQKKDADDRNRSVEKAIKDYEDKLRSSDPIDLLSFMRERDAEGLESLFPPAVLSAVPQLLFQAVPKSYEILKAQFGSLTFSDRGSVTPVKKEEQPIPIREALDKKQVDNTEQEENSRSLSIMRNPEYLKDFQVVSKFFSNLGKLRNLRPDKMWISAAGGGTNIVLVDRKGNVLRTVDTGCEMFGSSGIYITDNGELIFCDQDGKQVKKISSDFHVTTLFRTGNSKPRGISRLQSGNWVVCMSGNEVLRVYGGTGNVVREIGKGLLQRPFHVTLNKVNGDICVSDNDEQVVVFSSSGEKKFTYTGDITGFDPSDLCCDQLGNILIVDSYCVHIIDRDGHFLQYLVLEKIFCLGTIDIDDRGYAWIGNYSTRKVKAYKYLK